MKILTRYLIILALAIIGISGTLYSAEQVPNGKDVLKGKPLPTTAQQNRATQCLSYVVGFKDALYVSQIFQEKNGSAPFVCLPENNLNNEQALRIVLTREALIQLYSI